MSKQGILGMAMVLLFQDFIPQEQQKKPHKEDYCLFLLHYRSLACQGEQKGPIDRTWGGEVEERANVHNVLTPFLTSVNPDHRVFAPMPG